MLTYLLYSVNHWTQIQYWQPNVEVVKLYVFGTGYIPIAAKL
jgi:hypothetical protein